MDLSSLILSQSFLNLFTFSFCSTSWADEFSKFPKHCSKSCFLFDKIAFRLQGLPLCYFNSVIGWIKSTISTLDSYRFLLHSFRARFLNLGSIDILGQINLCIAGCLAASLVSTPKMPVTLPLPSCDNQKCLQILPHCPWGTKLPSVGNHCFRYLSFPNCKVLCFWD